MELEQPNAAVTPEIPAQSEKPKLVKQKFESYIENGAMFGIFIGNFFLSILTLGIYSFWGKTRTRKYIASHIMLDRTPFEYTGTGGELFKGFLKAYGIILVTFLIIGIVTKVSKLLGAVLYIGVDLALIPLIYMVIFMAFRYRLSRLTWRAIRFGLTGSTVEFAKVAIVEFLLTLVTFGVLLPRMQIRLWSEMIGQAHFGNKHFDYSGDYKKLMKIHLITYALTAVLFIAPFALIIVGAIAGAASGHKEIGSLLGFAALPLFALARIPRCWYKAKLREEELIGLRLGNMRFKSKATGKDFFMLSFVNALILIFSLGIAYPVVVARKVNFQIKYTLIAGDLGEVVSQAPKRKAGLTDSIATEMDLGGGLDLAL